MGQKIESKKLIEHLQEYWRDRPCPMCHARNWNVTDTVFELREYNQGTLSVGGGPILPVLPVTCSNCGMTFFISAIKAGLIKTSL